MKVQNVTMMSQTNQPKCERDNFHQLACLWLWNVPINSTPNVDKVAHLNKPKINKDVFFIVSCKIFGKNESFSPEIVHNK